MSSVALCHLATAVKTLIVNVAMLFTEVIKLHSSHSNTWIRATQKNLLNNCQQQRMESNSNYTDFRFSPHFIIIGILC